MNLTYRGISHQRLSSTLPLEGEMVEGIYHGLPIEIPLPQPSQPQEMMTEEMTYRGVKM